MLLIGRKDGPQPLIRPSFRSRDDSLVEVGSPSQTSTEDVLNSRVRAELLQCRSQRGLDRDTADDEVRPVASKKS
jgi:hypothetical protein